MRFSSEIDTSKVGEAWYVMKVSAQNAGKTKATEVERRFDITTFYDECGYMHRNKVRETCEDVL